MSIQKFERAGKEVVPSSANTVIEEGLKPHVYSVCTSITGPYLLDEQDKFTLPEKIYNWNAEKYQYILNCIRASKDSIGISFNGVKGTGKTLMVKRICNELELPIIKVESMPDSNQTKNILKWLDNNIKVPVVFLFDEFEKKFDANVQKEMLSFFDGTSDSSVKRIFLLTTNEFNLDENFTSRPGRIRHIVEFDDIRDANMIREYLEYELPYLNEEEIGWLIKFLRKKENATLDIFSKVVEEVKNNGFDAFKAVGAEMFNAMDHSTKYAIEYITFDLAQGESYDFSDFIEALEISIITRDKFANESITISNSVNKEDVTAEEYAKISHNANVAKIIRSVDYTYISNMACEPEEIEVGDKLELFSDNYEIKEVRNVQGKYYFSASDHDVPSDKLFVKVIETYSGTKF